jgi:excisionase family DNA binding protein
MGVKEKRDSQETALARVVPARTVEALSGLESAFLAFLQSKVPNAVVPIERRVFLTMAESAEFSGLPAAYLRRLIATGKLKAVKTGAGWRISRVEIEALASTLTANSRQLEEHELRDIEMNRRRRQGLA